MSRKMQLVIDSVYHTSMAEILKAYPNVQAFVVDLPREVYPTLHGHADIFVAVIPDGLIAEPRLYDQLMRLGAKRVFCGAHLIGEKYPETAAYNAVVTKNNILHCSKYTDAAILERTNGLTCLNTRQGYSRCTTLALTARHFLTSDRGIESVLRKQGLDVLFVEGTEILLQGQEHGFVGGAMGMEGEARLWVYGQLDALKEAAEVRIWCRRLGIEIVEMKEGPLEDIGGLLFWGI